MLDIGSFLDRRNLAGNVILNNVSQGVVDALLADERVALPTVELQNSAMFHHVNYSAHQAANLTIKGTGDTKVTLNGNRRGRDSIQGVYISGVREINTDRSNSV